MLPYVGPIATYPVFFAFAFVVGGATALRLARRVGVPPSRFVPIVVAGGIAAFAGAKLHSLIERGQRYSPVSWEWIAGYRYPGGLLACLATLAAIGRYGNGELSPATLGDIAAPSVAFASVVIRIGCFLSGCCFGRVSTLPWAIRFPIG